MLNPTNGKSALIDYDFIPGEKLSAKVIGLGNVKKGRTRSRHRKCLELTLVDRKKVISSYCIFSYSYILISILCCFEALH